MPQKSTKRLRVLVDKHEPLEPVLPLFHNTDGYKFRAILDSSPPAINANPSNEFGVEERIAYLFYGRPAYRPNALDPDRFSENTAFLPVAIVLNPEAIPAPIRLFPFDSGAFLAGLVDKQKHPEMPIQSFELAPNLRAAAQITGMFFGSNRSYFFGHAKKELALGPFEMEAQTYHQILLDHSTQNADDRKLTVEVQVGNDIMLSKDTVAGVIMPTAFLDDEAVKQVVISTWGIEPRTYDTYGIKPFEYVAEVYRLAKDLLEDQGMFR